MSDVWSGFETMIAQAVPGLEKNMCAACPRKRDNCTGPKAHDNSTTTGIWASESRRLWTGAALPQVEPFETVFARHVSPEVTWDRWDRRFWVKKQKNMEDQTLWIIEFLPCGRESVKRCRSSMLACLWSFLTMGYNG